MNGLVERKLSHLDLCAEQDVEFSRSTLLDEVHLLHDALPELSLDEIDCSVDLFGRRLQAPVLISGMTGGAARAAEINRGLALVAQKFGLGMGVGSQRAMLEHPELEDSYRLRDVAPDILLLANLGAVQARDLAPAAVAELVERIGADALCIHLNPAQELVQEEGDRDFRGCSAALERLCEELPVPLVVKETGCGMSPALLGRLKDMGVRYVDVAGAGGTSWTGVESLRGSSAQRLLGSELWNWGIPTAASVVYAHRSGFHTIASGGIRGALDAVRAFALGADTVSLALPFLRAFTSAGERGVMELAQTLTEGIRALLLLSGARRPAELQDQPRVLGPGLRAWTEGIDV